MTIMQVTKAIRMSELTEGRRTGTAFDMHPAWLRVTSLLCTALLIPGDLGVIVAQQASQSAQAPAVVSPDYLDSLVAPIALYPDPLLAQVLAASTYPLEIVQLEQWLEKHKDLKGKALADAVAKENWDPSVQGLADLPDVTRQLGDNIKWTTELGNAFLAQQSDVMDAVQRMRAKAQGAGKLKSSDQMTVDTRVVDNKSVVVIEQANPQVVYVPSYDPTVVWGAPPVYPYPPVYYPPAGYYAAGMAISFGVGVAMGAFWGGGGWGYNCGWGGNNSININNNNNFIRNSNNRISGGNQIRGGNQIGNGNRPTQWQHNPQHRGGAPYADRATANRFGGSTRGDTTARREANGRQNLGQRGGVGGNRSGAGGAGGFGGNRSGAGGASGFTGDRDRPSGAGGLGNRGSGGAGGLGNRGGGDRVGNRQIPSGGSGGAFGGARGGGAGARANGSRGASSFGGSRGGGFGGGGFRGGGRRR